MEKRIVEKMVKAMEIGAEDKVLLNFWGEEENLEHLEMFEEVFQEVGTNYQTLLHMSKVYAEKFNNANEGYDQVWYQRFEDVTAVIDLMCQAPGMLPKGLNEEKIPLFAEHLQKLFRLFSGKEKMIQVTMPTEANARLAGMDVNKYIERTTRALDIDYDKLKRDCKEIIANFEGCTRTIRTGENCVLTMDTTGRKWIADAGDGALPCGEVYIAPVEENSQGTIFFETLSVKEEGVFQNVTVTIRDGKIISSDCEAFNAFIDSLPEGGNVVAELGIGMNPNVKAVLGDSDIDENAVGTLHIAIGFNHLFGGKNQCPCHFDFVTVGTVE